MGVDLGFRKISNLVSQPPLGNCQLTKLLAKGNPKPAERVQEETLNPYTLHPARSRGPQNSELATASLVCRVLYVLGLLLGKSLNPTPWTTANSWDPSLPPQGFHRALGIVLL